MKKILLLIAILMINQMVLANNLFDIQLPKDYPQKIFDGDKYVPVQYTQVFFEKWANSIKDSNKNIEIKTLDKQYKATGLKESMDLYAPIISLKNEKGKNECTLYQGFVNSWAYHLLKSPMLYDKQNKICVAVAGKRDYTQTESPYYVEPKELENVVFILDKVKNTNGNPIILQEVVLLPEGIDNKTEKKYTKQIKKLYKRNAPK